MSTSAARTRSSFVQVAGVTALCTVAMVLTGASSVQAVGAPGTTSRISVSGTDDQANALSQGTAMSASGRFVLFTSDASNLVPGDTNDKSDAFVRDLATGRTERVSLTSAERQANGETSSGLGLAISDDGRYVAFTSYASNLVAHDTNGNVDVFVRDRKAGTTRRVSLTDGDRQSRYGGSHPALSDDGRLVVFTSGSANLVKHDTNNHDDVFVRDRARGTTRRVSVTSAEKQVYLGNHPAISGGGRYVAFLSDSRSVVPGDTNRRRDVFVRDRAKGTTTRVSLATDERQLRTTAWGTPSLSEGGRYVGFVSGSSVLVRDRTAGTTQTVADDNGVPGQVDPAPVRLSGDGRFVVFTSFGSLVAGDTNDRYDVFVKDRDTGSLERVSVSTAGTEGHGNSTTGAISDDGRVVAFQSAAPDLVSADTNAADDVFVRRR